MKQELDRQLCEKYPLIFANRHSSIETSCMAWGFDVGDGWYDILDALCFQIQYHIDQSHKRRKSLLEHNEKVKDDPSKSLLPVPEEVTQVVADQVKEKFGGLRFYYSGGDAYVDGLVMMAEEWAAKTCEVCGQRGTLREGGWVSVRCDEHA